MVNKSNKQPRHEAKGVGYTTEMCVKVHQVCVGEREDRLASQQLARSYTKISRPRPLIEKKKPPSFSSCFFPLHTYPSIGLCARTVNDAQRGGAKTLKFHGFGMFYFLPLLFKHRLLALGCFPSPPPLYRRFDNILPAAAAASRSGGEAALPRTTTECPALLGL